MWPEMRGWVVVSLLWQFLCSTIGQEEGSGNSAFIDHLRSEMGENSDIINHLGDGMEENSDRVRGDNILPEVDDYDYSQFIPIHNDFTDYDSDQTPGDDSFYEDSICWSPQCAGENGGENIMCMACPDTRPVRKTDIDLTVSCSPSGGVVGYNLTSVLEFGFENLTVELSYHKEDEEETLHMIEVEDFEDTEFSWPGLCSGIAYQFCVQVNEHQLCEACTPEGPPTSNPSTLTVYGGLTYLEASWPAVSPQCHDLTYQVLLDGVADDHPTNNTYHRISYLDPGLYNVSVRAENNAGHSSQPLPSTLYTIQELTPPVDVEVTHSVTNGSLVAEISWNNSINFEETSLTKRGYILNLYKDEELALTEQLTWDELEKMIVFDSTLPWNTSFSLQTFFGDHESKETKLSQLFSDVFDLSPPESVNIRNVVINDTLAAVIDWVSVVDFEEFEGLGMTMTLWTENNTELYSVIIPNPENSTSIFLDKYPWNTLVTLQTSARDALGQETGPFELFSAVELPAPENITVSHTVDNDTLTVLVEWEPAVSVEGFAADGKTSIEGLGTVVTLLDEESNLIRYEHVSLADNFVSITLDSGLPWNTQFTLRTFANEHNGDNTEPKELFTGIALTAPKDISVEYLIVNDILTADISWKHSVQDVFAGLGTNVEVSEDETVISSTQLLHTDTSFRIPLVAPVTFQSTFVLQTTAMKTKGDQTDSRQIFGGFELSPPKNIAVKHSYIDGDLTAVVNWENSVEKGFNGLQTVLSLSEQDSRVKREDYSKDQRTFFLSFEDSDANFSSSHLPWNTMFTLQSSVGDNRGPESEPMNLFNDIDLDPPEDISVTPEVFEGALTAVISWTNPNVFEDMSGPPVKIELWDETEDGELKLIGERTIPSDQNQLQISLDDGYPWQTRLSLNADFGTKQGPKSAYFDLFSHIQLTPPTNITITANHSTSMVEWSHSLELGQFQGLGTILNIWTVDPTSGNLTFLNQTLLPDSQDTSAVFSVESGLSQEASITLQSYVATFQSNQTELRGLFMPIALKQTQLNRILLILGLTCLLIIYILATAYCLRMVKKKGTYKLKEKHDRYTPGKFSESDQLLNPVIIKPPPLSEDGSYAAEQESIVSDSSLKNLLPTTRQPYLGESMVTLNKFNDDDDFMGNFDEDGSFIGDYMEKDEEEARAVQNKLLVFQQMYRNTGALYT